MTVSLCVVPAHRERGLIPSQILHIDFVCFPENCNNECPDVWAHTHTQTYSIRWLTPLGMVANRFRFNGERCRCSSVDLCRQTRIYGCDHVDKDYADARRSTRKTTGTSSCNCCSWLNCILTTTNMYSATTRSSRPKHWYIFNDYIKEQHFRCMKRLYYPRLASTRLAPTQRIHNLDFMFLFFVCGRTNAAM